MNSGLTKREKILIFIAVVVAMVVASVRFMILPMYNTYVERSEKLDALSAEKMAVELKILNESLTREGYENAVKSYEELKERYPFVMSNEEIDRILTGLCLDNGLSPVKLGISAAGSGGRNQSGGGDADSFTAFSAVSANMNLNGDYDSLKNLVDAVEGIDYIRLRRVLLSYPRSASGVGAPSISVVFEVTMLRDMPEE